MQMARSVSYFISSRINPILLSFKCEIDDTALTFEKHEKRDNGAKQLCCLTLYTLMDGGLLRY